MRHRLTAWSAALLALLAGCAPSTTTPVYDATEVAREAEIQKNLARKATSPGAPAASLPVGSSFAASAPIPSGIPLRQGERLVPAGTSPTIPFPGAPAFRSKLERLNYVATRVSVAAAPFCGEQVIEVRLGDSPVKRCNYPWTIVQKTGINAAADGKRIYVYADLLDVAESDDELALVIAHELAHNAMKHRDKKTGNALLGTLLGVAVYAATGVDMTKVASDLAGQVYSQEFEAEADYVGTYYAALAGYDYRNAATFMRRLGALHPAAIGHGSSHPPTAERFVAIQAAAREIDAKLAEGVPLVPNGVAAVKGPIAALVLGPALPQAEPAAAQAAPVLPESGGEAQRIACREAGLAFAVPGTYTCRRFPEGPGADGKGTFRRVELTGSYGARDEHRVALQLLQAIGARGRLVPGAAAAAIRSVSESAGQGTRWSSPRHLGDAETMSFVDGDGRECIGFVRYGGADAAGLAYSRRLAGFFCTTGRAVGDDEAKAMLTHVAVSGS